MVVTGNGLNTLLLNNTRSVPCLNRTVPRSLAEIISWLNHLAMSAPDSVRWVAGTLTAAEFGSDGVEMLVSLSPLSENLVFFLRIVESRRFLSLLADFALKPENY